MNLREATFSGFPSAEPFLKWAGGKRQLRPQILSQLLPLLPNATYFEPFLGGGAVYFGLRPKRAILSDLNEALVEAFVVVRDDVGKVISRLRRMHYSEDEYYRIRSSRPRTPAGRAARLIYLNKTCFNGLYRENLKGEFNVPFGRHGPNLVHCDEYQLLAASACLGDARVKAADFSEAVKVARKGDVVYFDPPYITSHKNNGFVEYNAKIFSWDDQERLADVAAELGHKGVKVVITNADHKGIVDLYLSSGRFRVHRLQRWSTMAGAATKRYPGHELLFVSESGVKS